MGKKVFFTSALPYVNGDFHMGHALEFIQSDIFFRYNKMVGNMCFYFSGDDCHGTPIMLKSFKSGMSIDYLINFYRISHLKDLNTLGILADSFYLTHSYENEFFSRRIFCFLKFNDFIFEESIYQLFDEEKKLFLPDRYVIGCCPKCFASGQYGDICEKCSYKYESGELLDPISVLSNTIPIKKLSMHYFFDLNLFNNFLNDWTSSLSQKSIFNKLFDWFTSGLKAWDISRDLPYFGFKIPNEYFRFFYVWLDAPIGYISSIYNFTLNNNIEFSSLFDSKSEYFFYHFIGKDIIYFHTLFWPAILSACDFKLPNDVFVHGFLTIDGKKMSKSSGTFLILNDFLDKMEPDYIRYYFAAKSNNNVSDIDFKLSEFIDKINSDLISKFVNIGGRCAGLICKHFDFKFSNNVLDKNIFYEYLMVYDTIVEFYEKRLYSKIVSYIMKYADYLNLYLDREKPWILVINHDSFNRAHDVCTMVLNLFIVLLFCFRPILPDLFDRFEYILNLKHCDITYGCIKKPILNLKIKPYIHVYKKIDKLNIDV